MPTLAEIAALLSVPPPGNRGDQHITGLATLDEAEPGQISFLGSEQYLPQLEQSRASAVIVQRRLKVPPQWEPRSLRVDDADLAVAQVLALFAPPVPRPSPGVDPTARVAPSAVIGESVAIAPHVVIGART
jgi:UDP-3-O-[3-hydroxymyristoyl] glucosamine N-acyltransferase